MINSIKLLLLRNGEFLQFNADFLKIVNLNNPATLQVEAAYNELFAIKQSIEALFKTDTSNPITEELEVLDARRDAAITGISTVISGYTSYYDNNIKAAAIKLNNHLALFGAGIARDNYQSETATIRSIVEDWTNKPELAAAITTLNLGGWKTELEAVNTSFNTKYLARTQEFGAVSADTIKTKRQEAINAFYKLRNNINAHFILQDGAEPYNKVTNELNALIDQYNKLLAARQGGGDSEPPAPNQP
jgi:hypothetical protein